MPGTLRIGTSGWNYRHFGALRHLDAYAREFGTVEVNYSFYRLPTRSTYASWAAQTPDDFCFAVKLSRYITHVKRLRGAKTPTRKFLGRAKPLGARLGPILVQLPENAHADAARLAKFLEGVRALGRDLRIALEVRHESWLASDDALAALARANAALVFAHSGRYPYPEAEPLTADFVYLRFHGPKALFASPYGVAGLRPFAAKIRRWLRGGRDVYAYFNNDAHGHALADARTLVRLTTKGARGGSGSAGASRPRRSSRPAARADRRARRPRAGRRAR
jgi:uncharacterized protein YecE (DUF72 family)